MHVLVLVVVVLHVLPAVFWVGSTLVWARGEAPTAPLLRAQSGAALVAVANGVGLWFLFHRGGAHDVAARVVGAGAIAAMVALVLQAMIVTPAAVRLGGADPSEAAGLRCRIMKGQRTAAPLLMIAVACMVVARYV